MENAVQMIIQFSGAATNLDMAGELRRRAGLLEGMTPKEAASRDNTDSEPASVKKKASTKTAAEPASSIDEEEEDDFGSKKKPAKKAAASFDDDEEETEEEETPPKKAAGKAPKITLDDVNDACKTRATDEGGGKAGRDVVLGILKKKFKTTSVGELKPEQYAAVIEIMTGE